MIGDLVKNGEDLVMIRELVMDSRAAESQLRCLQQLRRLWFAGLDAIRFFEATNPEVPHYGCAGMAESQAEWIVDLTTKVVLQVPTWLHGRLC